jgi:hypothetical protein
MHRERPLVQIERCANSLRLVQSARLFLGAATSDLNVDPWIQANSSPVGAERLHALGVITLRWNMCEYGLFGIFCEVVRLPIEECWALVQPNSAASGLS